MLNSLRAKLSKLRFQGKITQEEYEDLINKLDEHDEAIIKLARPKGKWIYSEYHTWICSICGSNPHRGTGFVPSKDGMKMQWKYCNVCGAEMGVSDGQI